MDSDSRFTVPDLDDGVPLDDDAEALDAGPGDHTAGTALPGGDQ